MRNQSLVFQPVGVELSQIWPIFRPILVYWIAIESNCPDWRKGERVMTRIWVRGSMVRYEGSRVLVVVFEKVVNGLGEFSHASENTEAEFVVR